MSYAETMAALEDKRAKILTLRKEMQGLQAAVAPQAVDDYVLTGWDGPVKLSELFRGRRDLLVIHNMGTGCAACTMWADGFNGVYDHLAARAAFVLASPNPVATQKQFAASRGWRFPMVSYEGSRFAEEMGFRDGEDPIDIRLGGWSPGVSAFRQEGGRIVRLSNTGFDDGDGFCVVFSLFDLFPDGVADWRPKYSYG